MKVIVLLMIIGIKRLMYGLENGINYDYKVSYVFLLCKTFQKKCIYV